MKAKTSPIGRLMVIVFVADGIAWSSYWALAGLSGSRRRRLHQKATARTIRSRMTIRSSMKPPPPPLSLPAGAVDGAGAEVAGAAAAVAGAAAVGVGGGAVPASIVSGCQTIRLGVLFSTRMPIRAGPAVAGG